MSLKSEGGPITQHFHVSIYIYVFFRTALPCSGGYYMERGGMPLHDVVGINCENGSTIENQGSAVKYMG